MQLANDYLPLPVPWNQAQHEQRRRRMGALLVEEPALQQFNDALRAADPQHRQLSADQICSAARRLYEQASPLPVPASIFERLRCVGLLHTMQADRDWRMQDDAAAHADTVLTYFFQRDELIPYNAPVIGHLDDAILADAAWPALVPEVADYLDYRRLRRIEAELRGLRPIQFHFNRDDWLEAREAELGWKQHLREHGLRHYLEPGSNTYFRVH